ncbi:carboxypeptidase-like regulatory domain-containing protein [Edaphocola flava]|uniref:carboxypeptidase-like regulatory domain-containing protein n=1 Tax=Edaphocola flava TaxID=2499629 RepID=UPI00100AD152|nr:carboxypeptidase-like regulatory domain-containing protein [Edaphocola flava]
MLPEEKGKFCLSCQKSVIDFSSMSDAQIVRVLEQSSGAICGRMRASQQQRDLKMITPNSNWFFAVCRSAVGLMFALGTNNAIAQEKHSNKIELVPISPADMSKIDSAKEYLMGRVTDQDGNELPGAVIQIKDIDVVMLSDDFGIFSLPIPLNLQQQTFTIVVKYFGNEPIEKIIAPVQYQQNQLLITLYYDMSIGGQVGGVCATKKRLWWQFWKPKYF